MKFPSIGTIGSIALLGGIGYVIYKFYKGDWQLPNLGNLLGLQDTIKESGTAGAVGDIIYNIPYPDLRERVTSQVEQDKTIDEYYSVMPPDSPTPTPKQIADRTVARVVAEDITGMGIPAYTVPILNAVTIGSGLAAIQRNEEYIASLPAPVQTDIYQQQTEKRIEQLTTDPVTMLAGVLAGPIGLAAAILPDLIRGATGPTEPSADPKPSIQPTVWQPAPTPEPEPTGQFDPVAQFVQEREEAIRLEVEEKPYLAPFITPTITERSPVPYVPPAPAPAPYVAPAPAPYVRPPAPYVAPAPVVTPRIQTAIDRFRDMGYRF